jgi:hypothetical protein
MEVAVPAASSRAWYGASIAEFLQSSPDAIIGCLARNGDFVLLSTQKEAWLQQIEILRSCLAGLTGTLFLEFNIPRMGRRIDAVLVIGPVVFVVEFKTGESVFDRAATDQVWDYALDLKNFHEASHSVAIVPILVATGSEHPSSARLEAHETVSIAPCGCRWKCFVMQSMYRCEELRVSRSTEKDGHNHRIVQRRRLSRQRERCMRSTPLRLSHGSMRAPRIWQLPHVELKSWWTRHGQADAS